MPSSAAAAPESGALVKFHAKNYADWVGKAHNKALDDFAARLADKAKGAPKNLCAEIVEFMSDPARVPLGKDKSTREQRRGYAVRGLSATQMCRGQLADNGSPKLWLASAARSANFSANLDGVSAAANSLLDQIRAAQSAATTADGLATTLTPILSQADQLVSGERDLVYAVASVAQSSFEYWLANLQPQADQVETTYGGCLVQYSDESYALSSCMGIAGAPIIPTTYRNLGNRAQLLFVASSQSACDSRLNMGEAVAGDIAGAVTGGLTGWAFSPPGILMGAVLGGTTTSLGIGVYQGARYAWCRVRGASSGPRDIKTT